MWIFQLSVPPQTELIMPCGVTGGLPTAVKLQRACVNRFNCQTNQTSLKMSTVLYVHPQMANFSRNFEPWLLKLYNSEIYTSMGQAWVWIGGKALSFKQESQSSWDSGSLRVYPELCVTTQGTLKKKREIFVFWLVRGMKTGGDINHR